VRRVLLALLVLLAACSDGKDSVSEGKTSVEQGRQLTTVQEGKLTVCVTAPNAPFAFEEGGELRGIEVDLAKAVAGRLGLAADTVRSADVIADLGAGKCDVAAASDDPDLRGVERTKPYFEVHEALLVRMGDEAKYGDFDALRGKPVGFPFTAAAMVYSVDHAGDVVMRQYQTPAEAIDGLRRGQVEAVVVDHALALYTSMTGGDIAVGAVLDPTEPMDHYIFAVPSGKTALKEAVENGLAQVRGDDLYRTILTNYLGSTAGQA
jgi:polar amino acid transport system substrate-binding protein